MLLRRLTVAALSAATVLTAAPAAAALPAPAPEPVPSWPWVPLPPVSPAGEDRLTITVSGSGDRAADGLHTLDCHPKGGTHQKAQAACDRLDEATRYGKDPFARVPHANCTMIYGGPATARLTGTWAGRPVNAHFSRTNGCEIARWNNLLPVLPDVAG